MNDHHWQDAVKYIVDLLSIGVVLGTLIKILPAIAAFMSIIWSAIRIYETRTVQRFLGKKG